MCTVRAPHEILIFLLSSSARYYVLSLHSGSLKYHFKDKLFTGCSTREQEKSPKVLVIRGDSEPAMSFGKWKVKTLETLASVTQLIPGRFFNRGSIRIWRVSRLALHWRRWRGDEGKGNSEVQGEKLRVHTSRYSLHLNEGCTSFFAHCRSHAIMIANEGSSTWLHMSWSRRQLDRAVTMRSARFALLAMTYRSVLL